NARRRAGWRDSIDSMHSQVGGAEDPAYGNRSGDGSGSGFPSCSGGTGDEGGGMGRDGPAESCLPSPVRGRGRDSAFPAEAGVARSRASAEPRLQPRVLVMTSRDRRALVIGGVSVAVAHLLLRGLPWTVRSALAADVDLR